MSMLELLHQKFEYKNDGLHWREGRYAGRAGSLRPNGYRHICLKVDGKKKFYLEHRLCFYYMKGRWPTEIDHIDRDKANNAWSNLREVSRQENNRNKSNGHNIRKSCQKWVAEIKMKGVPTYIGRFDTYQEALEARKQAEIQHWGYTNIC